MTESKQLRVLVTNDDGPPNDTDSPFIRDFAAMVEKELGWDVKVVIPSNQKSWIGTAYDLKRVIGCSYYNPKSGNISAERPSTDSDVNSHNSWTLLDGTPATCANIAIHNLYPNEIDLVLSGPNYGRNSSNALSVSSGTLGAALSSSISGKPAIAISYGIVERPIPTGAVSRAHKMAVEIVKKLWYQDFSKRGENQPQSQLIPKVNSEADFYSVNIPLITKLAEKELPVEWTTVGMTSYGRLFRSMLDGNNATSSGGDINSSTEKDEEERKQNGFKYGPDFTGLLNPDPSTLTHGTDNWAFYHGVVSVTPYKASFALGAAKLDIKL